jgi:adenylate kinase family enzyme
VVIMNKTTHKRILIIGDAGRGKTTFGKKLSEKTRIPHFSTDDFYWEKKFTVERSKDLAAQMINDNVYFKLDSWVVDGTTKSLIKEGLEKSDIIYLLIHKNILSQYLILIKRYLKRRNSEKEKESFIDMLGMLKHVTKKRYSRNYSSHMSHLMNLLEPYKGKVVELSSFKAIERELRRF